MTDELTRDAFLGGRLQLWQPRRGYRAGVDPVLLAATVPAQPGQSVLDLGCGVGTALLCVGTRVSGLDLTGVERQPSYAALARRNLDENGLTGQIVTADLTDLPDAIRQRQFHHVISNPPYFDRQRGARALNPGRDQGRGEDTPLAIWLDAAIRRLAPGGYLSVIQHVGRLHDVLAVLHGRLGSVIVQPLVARQERPPHLVLVQARLGGKGDFQLAQALVMHAGAAHNTDGDDYTPPVSAALRHGEKLPILI